MHARPGALTHRGQTRRCCRQTHQGGAVLMMVKVEAIIRPQRMDAVREALDDAGVRG
jgi:hypothetical protein